MSEEAKTEKAPAEAPAAHASGGGGGGGGNKLVLILSAVNLLAVLGMGAVLFISFQKEKNKPSIEDIATEEGGEHGAAAGAHGGGGEHGAPAAAGHGGGGGEHGGGGGHGGGEHGGGAKKHQSNAGAIINLEQFTVNLSTPGTNNPVFVRVNISVEVLSADTEQEVNQRVPQVRNAIIDLFNSKRASDLATVEGRELLKDEIKNAINHFLVTGKIKGVFFTNFTVTG